MKPVIAIDHTANTPKYQQIMNAIIAAIDNEELKVGDRIPSVNEVSESTGVAKKTIVQAFEQLKQTGIITAIKYKGFFVASGNTRSQHNIFVLFNSFTAYKEEIYQGIKDALGNKGVVNIFFHHNNAAVFNSLIAQHTGKYTEYIIMPIRDKSIQASMEKLPQDKIYILDIGYRDWGAKYPSVCQHFEQDIYNVLQQALTKIRKYKKLVLVQGPAFYNLKQIEKGFLQFCKEFKLKADIIPNVKHRRIANGELYILVNDQDLLSLVRTLNDLSLKPGKDIGILSYNETPIKEIAGNGIATISTDFTRMGKDIMQMILKKKKAHLHNPARLTDRQSF